MNIVIIKLDVAFVIIGDMVANCIHRVCTLGSDVDFLETTPSPNSTACCASVITRMCVVELRKCFPGTQHLHMLGTNVDTSQLRPKVKYVAQLFVYRLS